MSLYNIYIISCFFVFFFIITLGKHYIASCNILLSWSSMSVYSSEGCLYVQSVTWILVLSKQDRYQNFMDIYLVVAMCNPDSRIIPVLPFCLLFTMIKSENQINYKYAKVLHQRAVTDTAVSITSFVYSYQQ